MRRWLKLHLGIDEASGDILSALVSPHHVPDGMLLAHVLLKDDECTFPHPSR